MATGTETQLAAVPSDGDPFAEQFAAEEVVAVNHGWANAPVVNYCIERIRAFAAVLTEEECAGQPQLAKAKQELMRQSS